jgi:hypothetical protein
MGNMPVDLGPQRATILRLAAETQLDPRTVKRAVEEGVGALKAAIDRERLREAAKRLGVKLREGDGK